MKTGIILAIGLLATALAGARSASADPTKWSSIGGGCVPAQPNIANANYTNVNGAISTMSISTATTVYCPVQVTGWNTGEPATLYMTCKNAAGSAGHQGHTDAYLYAVNKFTGVETQLATASCGTTTTVHSVFGNLTAPVSPATTNFDDSSFYYVKVVLNPRFGATADFSQQTLYGVWLDAPFFP